MDQPERTKASKDASEKRTIGRGVFRNCDGCGATLRAEEFTENYEVCPKCGKHYRLDGDGWIELLLDSGSWVELDEGLRSADPLQFHDGQSYSARLEAAQRKTGLSDAVAVGSGAIEGRPVEFGVFQFRFMGGSMGSVVGEKLARLFERALERKRPAILLSSSGGARMQEGVLSLMQMAKTVSALGQLREASIPFLSVLLHPTTGGVAASFALLGDVNIAEPEALIGFAGPRVIEQTIKQTLPEGFQSSEFQMEHGQIDIIASRHELRDTLSTLLSHMLD
ncbi:MAG: acetyl-CoA carboxylase, carboxyltransferase subunit beta [Myxococcota bacterium]